VVVAKYIPVTITVDEDKNCFPLLNPLQKYFPDVIEKTTGNSNSSPRWMMQSSLYHTASPSLKHLIETLSAILTIWSFGMIVPIEDLPAKTTE